MFQDDRMIPVLTAMVLMVVIGSFLQRVDVVNRFLGGNSAPVIELRDDEVAAPSSTLLRIDVFANDDGVTDEMRRRLSVITAPKCGRLFVRDGLLEYMADAGCEGLQTIRYTFGGAKADQVATVTARIRAPAGAGGNAPALPAAPEPAIAAASPPMPATAAPVARAPQIASADAPALPPVPASGGAADAGPDLAPVASLVAPSDDAMFSGGTATSRAGRDADLPAHIALSSPAGAVEVMPLPVAVAPAPIVADASSEHAPPELAAAAQTRRALTDPVAAMPAAAWPAGASSSIAGDAKTVALADPEVGRAALATAAPDGPAAMDTSDDTRVALAGTGAEPAAWLRHEVHGPTRGVSLAPGAAVGFGPASAAKLAALSGALSAEPAGTPIAAMPPAPGAAPALATAMPRGTPAGLAGLPEAELPDADTPSADLPGAATRVAALPDISAAARAAAPAVPPRAAVTIAALGKPFAAEPDLVAALAAAPLPAGAALPGRSLRGAAPGGPPALPAPSPGLPRHGLPGSAHSVLALADTATAADDSPRPVPNPEAAGPAFLLAVFGRGEAVAANEAATASNPIAEQGIPGGTAKPAVETRLAALAPMRSAPAAPGLSPAPGPALDALPVDRMVIVPTPRPVWLATGTDVRTASLAPTVDLPAAGGAGPVPAPRPDADAVSAVPCTTPPAMTLEVDNAAETIVGVDAPCHAATVADLSYSGLRLAVPLDGNGRGVVRVQGFEPNSPALLTFGDGSSIDFDLPFKNVDRISRVALAWDAPVELELNALEYGAAPGTPGHVRPGLARSFDEVRRSGGGYLTVWHPVGGHGQSVQIYSWYHRNGETAGVIKLLLDFVSRDRDRLAATCGDGPAAAPQFVVLRSDAGRPERPVIRQLAPLDCGRVAQQGRDNRLISGALDDLVIMSR